MSESDDSLLLLQEPEAGVRVLALNRPEKRNAITTDMLRALADALADVDADDQVRSAVITGSTTVFAAGADIHEIRAKDASQGLSDPRPALWQRLRNLRKPLIAAVEGWCLGAGNELMMCADIAVAGEGAKFAQPETNLGIIPGAGGCAVLTRLVGRTTALRMVLTGEPLSAEAARDAGLISEVVKDGQALEKAKELAAKIAARAPLALQQAKAVIRQTEETPLSAQLAMERQAFSLLLSSHDKDAGIDAFLNKERPDWLGR